MMFQLHALQRPAVSCMSLTIAHKPSLVSLTARTVCADANKPQKGHRLRTPVGSGSYEYRTSEYGQDCVLQMQINPKKVRTSHGLKLMRVRTHGLKLKPI